ncbi:hypothetical protein MMC30_007496 [Trapelia coarctata]|nr:hypothetical protein [Trapelia coarctata]
MEGDSDDDDVPQLSGDALGALQEFYNERDERQRRFEELKQAAEERSSRTLSMLDFAEDWNASQFWYSDDTATTLAKQLLDGATSATCIAVVSAPSVFIQLRNMLNSPEYADQDVPHVALLEYDERFSVLEGFVQYDFHSPLKLPPEMKGRYDRIICDPPFLKNVLTNEFSCHDCPVAIKIEYVQYSGYAEDENHCLHWRENGEPHTQGLFRDPDDIIRAKARSREIKQRVPLLRKLRMRSMALAMTLHCGKTLGKLIVRRLAE